jgi:hypothetical protein
MRAANIFGPALINCGFTFNFDSINFDIIASGLYRGFSMLRTKKSATKNKTGMMLEVNRNTTNRITVKNPFNRATCSSIFLNDIGQNALLLILFKISP